MNVRLFFLCSMLGFGISPVHGYELATHGRLTEQAFLKSSLEKDAQLLQDLGIDANSDSPFGNIYYDMSGSQVQERVANAFEKNEGRMRLPSEALTIKGWLMRGSIREDDLGQILGVNNGGDPHDDPYGSFFRVYNHFYDPALDRPLTTIVGVLGQKAPDWATGSAAVFTQPNTPNAGRRNHFTVFDAREAMYRALTGRDSQGNVVAATETERNKYWATTFRALGDVSHLIQDMGQPQHTRNDAHSGVIGFGEKSTFEAYIEARATGADNYSIDGSPPKKWNVLTYDGYDVPKLAKYSDYWSTREGSSGRGLADYSNRGFFSAGTNLGRNVYSSPSNNATGYTKESASGLLPNNPGHTISFLKGDVQDTLNPGSANIKMTTESAFDAFLANTTIPTKTFSLNRFNYDDMANLLIPRAVAYTAGLVNYFFRGKLDYGDDPINAGKHIIKNLGTESITGSFTLYYDAVDGKRYPVAGDSPNETWSNRTIDANQQLDNLSFTPPTNPAPKTSDVYMLVFKGDMGEEKTGSGAVGAVAAKYIQPVGATDYVAMSMPNPVPYRGVYVGVVDRGGPTISISYSGSGPQIASWTIKHADGTVASTGSGFWNPSVASSGGGGAFSVGTAVNWPLFNNNPWPYSSVRWEVFSGNLGYSSSGYGQYYPGYGGGASSFASLGYEELFSEDVAAEAGGKKTYVVASDGEKLFSLQWPYLDEVINSYPGYFIPQYSIASWSGGDRLWYWGPTFTSSIQGFHVATFNTPEDCAVLASYPAYIFTNPDPNYSSFYAAGAVYPNHEMYSLREAAGTYYAVKAEYTEVGISTVSEVSIGNSYNAAIDYLWAANEQAWVNVNPTREAEVRAWHADAKSGEQQARHRRTAWFKKNSEEFVAALMTGFAPSAEGVARSELKLSKLPDEWVYRIKRDVDTKYPSYPGTATGDGYWVTTKPAWWDESPDEDGPWAPYFVGATPIGIGKLTRRPIQYTETSWADTVQSDTSVNLSQAGEKVTQRVSTLQYTIPIKQQDGSTVNEVRTATITGYLTQTVTQHNDTKGTRLGMSRRDVYDNWYNREGATLPTGVPSMIAAPYLADRANSRIGVVLNGTVQNGYNADSTLGAVGNPLTYALYVPPFPKAFSTVTATVPDFIATWHKDAKIEYVPDGVGASNTLNDSALYGVTEIEITPVGLIANGAGNAAAGESVGIFSSGEDGTQVEIYGTAVYKFDWQTGTLTFKQWKPLLDAGGNEVASRIVPLPSGVLWGSSGIGNAIITYKGLHWPDVIAALKLRDEDAANGTFVYSKPAWYELVKAIKAR